MKGRTMQIKKRHLGILVLAMASIIALAFGATAAQAEPGGWWTPPANGETLIVNTTNSEYADDIAQANVVVDVYKIASAVPDGQYQTFNYEFDVEGFEGLSEEFEAAAAASDWGNMANSAAAIIKDGDYEHTTGDINQQITGLDDGLYVVLVHGSGVDNELSAHSKLYKYTFDPIVVTLPTTNTGTSDGQWQPEATVDIKASQTPLKGRLLITKSLTGFVGTEEATFTFHIESTPDSPYPYENDRSITMTSAGTSPAIEVTDIPAGTKVTVTEVHQGTRYRLVEGDSSVKEIVADEVVEEENLMLPEAVFVNEPSDDTKQGHGIENKFDLSKTGDAETDWDWVWTQVPEV